MKEHISYLTITKQLPGCIVTVLGRQPRMKNGQLEAAVREADMHIDRLDGDITKRCVVIPPSDDNGNGYQSIGVCNYTKPVFAEGTILSESGSSAVLQVADCATFTIVNTETGRVLLTHAGRWALRPPIACGDCTANIVSTAYRKIIGKSDPSRLIVYIVGAICPTHFRHDDAYGQELIRPFLERFGTDIFLGDPKDGCLDTAALISMQFRRFGVPETNITHADVCPFEEPGLSSHRRDGRERTHANTVIALRTR